MQLCGEYNRGTTHCLMSSLKTIIRVGPFVTFVIHIVILKRGLITLFQINLWDILSFHFGLFQNAMAGVCKLMILVLLFSGQRFIFTHLSRVHFCQKIQPPISLLYTYYYTVIYDAKKHLLFGGNIKAKILSKHRNTLQFVHIFHEHLNSNKKPRTACKLQFKK